MDSVEQAVRAYFDALSSSDADAAAAVFAKDGSLMRDEFGTVTGRDEIHAVFTQMFQALRAVRVLHIDRITETADLASAQTHSTGPVTMLADNKTVPVEARELFVLRRSADGWRIIDYMFNRPGPGA